jgi:cold shock CspA family protein
MSPLIAVGRVSWFKLDKKFGFVELEGDAATPSCTSLC